jgi:hypothetical protein
MNNSRQDYKMNVNIYIELKEDLEKLGLKDNISIENVIIQLLKDYVHDKNMPQPMSSKELDKLLVDGKFWDN